jgi:hypothetical protein
MSKFSATALQHSGDGARLDSLMSAIYSYLDMREV